MTKEINISLLFKVFKSAWWKILIITVAVAVAVAAFTAFAIDPKYAATTKFYVINTSTTSEYTTTALLSAAEYLANDYIEIINGDDMMEMVKGKLESNQELKDKGYTTFNKSEIRGMITSATSSESSTFTITATHTDYAVAYYVCKALESTEALEIIKNAARPSYSSNIYQWRDLNGDGKKDADEFSTISETDLECVKVLRSPSQDVPAPVSPDVVNYTFIAAVASAVIAYAIFLVKKLADTVIRGEESAKDLVDETVIGDIPTWTKSATTAKEEDKK
ncbi:MAG: hypothetical protein E7577_01010 [Ruminococcaceae bacterium]|nr:hypothetical protein [Oscillospiraceae bacterium]